MADEDPEIELDSLSSAQAFGEALTTVRHSAGLSLRDLARMTGVPFGTLGSYSSGRHLPRDSNVLRTYLRACGVTEADRLRDWVDCLRRLRSPLGRPARAGAARREQATSTL